MLSQSASKENIQGLLTHSVASMNAQGGFSVHYPGPEGNLMLALGLVVGVLGQRGLRRDVLPDLCGRPGPQEEQEEPEEPDFSNESAQQRSRQEGNHNFNH